MSILELIAAVSASFFTLLIAYKGIFEKYVDARLERKKALRSKKQIENSNDRTIKNIVEIKDKVRLILKTYDCNRVFIFGLHNSGEILTPFCEKKISVYDEDTKASIIPDIKPDWQNRIVNHEMLKFINQINTQENNEIDLSDYADNISIREMLNAIHGHEVFIVKIGWFGKDKLMFLVLQRDANFHKVKLQPYQKNKIKHNAMEFKELITTVQDYLL